MSKKKYVGVYSTTLKDGTPSFRASITYCGKHIALGSFSDIKTASNVYKDAAKVLEDEKITISSYKKTMSLPFDKKERETKTKK